MRLDSTELQRSKVMVVVVILTNLAILASKLGHVALEIAQKIYEIIKLELKSFLVAQSACFNLYLFRFESFSKIGVYEGHFAVSILKAILTLFTFFSISQL